MNHIYTAVKEGPAWYRANGFVERQIRTVKATLKKAKKTNTDLDLALLFLRTTPVSHNMDSPGQSVMFHDYHTKQWQPA